jgi:hypothetical protein
MDSDADQRTGHSSGQCDAVIVREFGEAWKLANQPGRWERFLAAPVIFKGSTR